MIKKNKKRTILYKAIGLALAVSSFNSYAAQDSANDEEENESLDKIVVIGSKIRTDEMNDTVPLEVIIARDAIDRGITSIGALLRESTLASGSSQVTSATSTAFVQNGGTGVETLSLRGLGANRTLVLLNGRRAGPAGIGGSVSSFDFNTIPLSAVERIEILKDGSSSLYGSDAIAGVINIVTKGGDESSIDIFTSQPSQGGGESSRFSATWGRSNGTSSFRATIDYDKQSELKQGERDYFSCGEDYFFDGNTNNRADQIDPRTGNPRCTDTLWGHVWLYNYGASNFPGGGARLMQYDYDGDLSNYLTPLVAQNPGDFQAPPGWFNVSGGGPVTNADHPFQDLTSLIPESTRATLFLSGDHKFSDNVTGYAEVLYNRRTTRVGGYRQFWTFLESENDVFFGGDPLSAGWTGDVLMSPTAITDHFGQDIDVDYTRVVAGLSGVIDDRWYWDMSVQSSRSDADYNNDIIYADSVYISDPFEDAGYQSGSCVGTVTSHNGTPCVDVPWLDPQFLAGNIGQEYKDFLFGTDLGNTLYKQSTFEASVTGDLFEMPAGYAAGAFGVQYQQDEIRDTPGEQTRAGNSWGLSTAGITEGDNTTKAVFAEIALPLLADKTLVKALNFTASGRYTDVDNTGSATTYKAGIAWHIAGGVTLRGSTGTSFRAPGLYELYLNNQTSFISTGTDPCIDIDDNLGNGNITQNIFDNCTADGFPGDFQGGAITPQSLTGGGLGTLESETSESQTWGIVWRPENINMSVSLDYFDFLIEGEVTTLSAAQILNECYNADPSDFATEPLCNAFDRDENNILTDVRATFINIATQENKGFDFKIDYETDIPWGTLALRTEHTYQKVSKRGLFADTVEDFNGSFGEPKHTANFLAKFDRNNWYVSWFTSFVGKTDQSEFSNEFITYNGSEPGAVRRVVRLGGTSYHTLSVGYTHEQSGIRAVLGVRNLTDNVPPRLSRGVGSRIGNSALYSQYDFIGRSFFLSLKYDF